MRPIPFGKPMLSAAVVNAVNEVIETGIFVHGHWTKKFESDFAVFTGAASAISVSSCTAGLHMAHHHLSAGRKGEVLCPAQSHVATAHAIELAGLVPVFVDCDPENGNISLEEFEKKITSKTIGATIVHFNGVPVEIKEIADMCRTKGLYLVEDCAISLGASSDGKHVGLFGDVGVFSFHPVKQMTTGEGGMIISSRDCQRDFELLRAFGVDRQFGERIQPGMYDVPTLGFNYRMPEIPAAIGVHQLCNLDNFLSARKSNYSILEQGFSAFSGVKILGSHEKGKGRSYYNFVAIFDPKLGLHRNEIQKTLAEHSIGTSIYYPHPIPRLHYYKQKYTYDLREFQNATLISDHSLSFPIGPHLDEEDMGFILEIISETLK